MYAFGHLKCLLLLFVVYFILSRRLYLFFSYFGNSSGSSPIQFLTVHGHAYGTGRAAWPLIPLSFYNNFKGFTHIPTFFSFRSIRRLIFHSLRKFDGRQMIRLPSYHAKQIAGRAGRFGTEFPEGYVTT